MTTYKGYNILFNNEEGYYIISDEKDIIKDNNGKPYLFSATGTAEGFIDDLIRKSLKTLPDYLEQIKVDDEEYPEDSIYSQLTNLMPGYEIYTWNADMIGSVEFAQEYSDIISNSLHEGKITDIQCSQWTADDNSFVAIVAAIKVEK